MTAGSRWKGTASRLVATGACLLALAGCNSISHDVNSIKNAVSSLGELQGKLHELSHLASKINPKVLKGLHLTRPKGTSQAEWEADLKKDVAALERAASGK